MKPINIAEDFIVPVDLITDTFRLEVLSPAVGEKDYDAVMSSRERLRTVFSENTEWPRDNMTLQDNIRDLEKHKKEFDEKIAFAYTVLEPSGEKCIGCVYIDPPSKNDYDCEVYLWVRDSEFHLDKLLFDTIKEWLTNTWGFRNPVFPGREISWCDWKKSH